MRDTRFDVVAFLTAGEGEAAAAPIGPNGPAEAVRFRLLAHVVEPLRPLGGPGTGKLQIGLLGAEFTKQDPIRRHALRARPIGDLLEALGDRVAVESGATIAFQPVLRVAVRRRFLILREVRFTDCSGCCFQNSPPLNARVPGKARQPGTAHHSTTRPDE